MSEHPPDPNLDDTDHGLDRTRATGDRTRGIPPVTRVGPAQPPPPPPRRSAAPPARATPRRGRARSRRDSGLYLPLWSLALVLVIVMATVAGLVLLVLSIGGNEAPEAPPVVIVSSPVPTDRPAGFAASPATPTIPPELDPISGGSAPPSVPPLRMDGPTLPAVEFTATPMTIIVGRQVRVIDVGAQQLNVRDAPGVTGSTVVFRAEEESTFNVIGGPQQADGLTWWQIEDPFNLTRTGWAASNYLQAIADDNA